MDSHGLSVTQYAFCQRAGCLIICDTSYGSEMLKLVDKCQEGIGTYPAYSRQRLSWGNTGVCVGSVSWSGGRCAYGDEKVGRRLWCCPFEKCLRPLSAR